MTDKREQVCAWLGPLLGLAALVLYGWTLSRGPYPGESATMMARELGLDPFQGGTHPLWRWVVDALVRVPVGGLVLRLNALSAVCGGLAVWMLFRVMSDAVWLTAEVTDDNRRAVGTASTLAGLASALALMGALPFWYAATRFHVATFDLLYLLIVARVFIGFVRHGSARWGVLFAALYGVGVAEFATFIVLGPLAAVGVLLVLWFEGDLRWQRVLAMGGAVLGGALFYAVAAWQLLGSDEFVLTASGGIGKALYFVWRGQYLLIARSLPQLGWLLVILVGIVPWLAVLLVAHRGLNEEKDWGFFVLHAIMTAVVAAVLFNAPFAPWRLLGPWRLLVTPYLLLASAFGYLTAYWFLFPRLWGERAEPEERGLRWVRAHGGWVPAALLLGAGAMPLVLNFKVADGRSSGPLNGFARAVVRSAADKAWLVSDDTLDYNLILAAKEEGLPLRVLSMRWGNNPTYMRWVARAFDDPRLKSLAEVDELAFLREWMAGDTNFNAKVALLSLPDLWMAGGYRPVPDRAAFAGQRAGEPLDPDALWERHESFWREPFIAGLRDAREGDPLVATYASFALRHAGMVANNLGVLMEDLERPRQAYEAYAHARLLDPSNASALLNQCVMLDHGYAAPDAEAVRMCFTNFTRNLKQKMQIWSLSRYYGYVRIPEAFANLGMVWALSGEPGMAVAGYKRAIELAPGRKDQLSEGLAMAYLAQDQKEEGEALYRELLAKDPRNTRAMIALARLMGRQNRFDEAVQMLDRAEKAGLSKESVAMEYATMHMAAGDAGKARVALQELVEVKPDLIPAWAMLAGVLMQMGDKKALDDCERKLGRVKGKDFLATVVLAQMAISRADYVGARTCLDMALTLRPATPLLLELLLRLDVQEGWRDLAERHVRLLLLLDSGHAFANLVLASFLIERKEYVLAENTLRKSLERQRTPMALNDLAWVRQERGDFEEAEALSREAIKADAKQHNYWDTLGTVLMHRGKLDEAEEALRKAASLYAQDPTVQVHLVDLFVKRGERRKAVDLANALLGSANLKADDREKMRQLVRSGPE
jgi:tetratricopeptide (TPR) repeat protein